MGSVADAIRSKFKGKVGDGNVKAAEAAFEAASPRHAKETTLPSQSRAQQPSRRPSRCAGPR